MDSPQKTDGETPIGYSHNRMLTRDEEDRLARAYRRGEHAAGQRLVLHHQPLADRMAYGLSRSEVVMDDVRQEARIGLMKALGNYDPDAGVRFSTYAMWWIRASINEHRIRSHSVVSLSGSAGSRRLFYKLKSTKARLGILHDGDLTSDEAALVAADLDVPVDSVVFMNRQMMPGYVSSLDAPVGAEEGSATRMDMLVDPDANEDDLHDRLDAERTTERVREILSTFKPREREIIERRTIGGATLQDLADMFGITRERVRQLEVRAVKTIRAALVGGYGYAAR